MRKNSYDRPTSPYDASRRVRSRFSLPFLRSRIHPLVLVPVFILGFAASRLNPEEPQLPTPIYAGDPYSDEAYRPFLPPDAPPLAKEDGDFEESTAARRERTAARRAAIAAAVGGNFGDDSDDLWAGNGGDEFTSSSSSSRPPYFQEKDGYLYYPAKIPQVSMEIPKANLPHKSRPFDNLLDLPPTAKRVSGKEPAYKSPPRSPYIAPDTVFKNPNALHPPPLEHPILPQQPPLPRGAVGGNRPYVNNRPAGPAAAAAAAGKAAQDRRVGANAAAMMKANREGKPFRPARPFDLVQEERRRERLKAQEQKAHAGAALDDNQRAFDRMERRKQMAAGQGAGAAAGAGEWAQPLMPEWDGGKSEEEERQEEDEEEEEEEEEAGGFLAGGSGGGSGEFSYSEDAAKADEDATLLLVWDHMTLQEKSELSPAELQIFEDLALARAQAKAEEFGAVVPEEEEEEEEEEDEDEGVPANRRARLAKRSFDVEDTVEDLDQPIEAKVEKRAAPVDAKATTAQDRVHPITILMKEAEEKWHAMLGRQSQTLFEAVMEYQKRYKRKPPLGFDAWWKYAMQNHVILVDEYDQIHEDILPFFSLKASEIRDRAKTLATASAVPYQSDTFTITIKDGSMRASGSQARSQRSEDTQDVMSEFAESLPDMAMTFSSGTLPVTVISGEARKRHVHYAEQGQILHAEQSVEILENPSFQHWQGLCAPNSTARRAADGYSGESPTGLSFVSTDHIPAMDMCHHPEIQMQNGFTAWNGPRPYLLEPLFTWSKTAMHSDILSAPLDNYYDDVGLVPTWAKKLVNKVLWRGQTSGTFRQQGTPWRSSQRDRLVRLTNEIDGQREVRFADPAANDAVRNFVGPAGDINHFYFDTGFTGQPTQCNVGDTTCAYMQKDTKFARAMTDDQANTYKYVVDVDGNGFSGDFHRLMQTGSVVFKSTIFPEWYSKRIMPWLHYVPIKSDYSDLHDAAAFFIGAPDGTGSHDELAAKIAANAQKWVEEHWRETDLAAYQFRLALEYARLISREEEGSHDFVME